MKILKNKISFLPLFLLILLILLSIIAILNNNNNFDESALKKTEQAIILPEFSLPNLFSGEIMSKNDFINDENKYSLVNFFASWCRTCLEEHKILLQLKDEDIIDIYGVAWRDFQDNTIRFLQENGNPFKKTAIDSAGLFNNIINLKAVPESILIDSKGRIILKFQGNLSSEDIEIIKKLSNKK